jgi:hypothetical protein
VVAGNTNEDVIPWTTDEDVGVPYVLFPLLNFSFTLEPAASFLPGFGFWEITRPFFTLSENALVTFPSEQCAFPIARFAARSLLPFTLGTTQMTLNVAMTERLALMVRVQLPLPEQSPDQPANLERAEATAVSVTAVPCLKAWAQVEPQLIPAGLELTVPVPLPPFVSVSVLSGGGGGGGAVKSALIEVVRKAG